MNEQLLAKLSKVYGPNFVGIASKSESGYRNKSYKLTSEDGEVYNFLVYKDEPNIVKTVQRANHTSNYLASLGYPSRQSIKTKAGGDILILRKQNNSPTTRYAGMYNYLPGNTIPWEGFTMKHIKLLGWLMSDLHADLNINKTSGVYDFTTKKSIISQSFHLNFPSVFDVLKDQMSKVFDYFETTNVRSALEKKLKLKIDRDQIILLANHLETIETALMSQMSIISLLHMDLVRGNVLFSSQRSAVSGQQAVVSVPDLVGSPVTSDQSKVYTLEGVTVSGIIDFEKVAFGPPVVDVARTLAFLLTDGKHKVDDKIRKYFLQSGYEKRGKSSLLSPVNQLKYLDTLLIFFWLYDFYKFLKHNPYEFLELNEHFVRTRERLLKAKVLRWG